jgi:hypothetical protein
MQDAAYAAKPNDTTSERPRVLDALAVIFDVDGTLVDSVDYHAEAWRQAFAISGFDFAFDRIRGQIGKGGDQLMPVFLKPEVIDAYGERSKSGAPKFSTATSCTGCAASPWCASSSNS